MTSQNQKKCQHRTEVYSRSVGYYRPVQTWNRGKQEEYLHRRPFDLAQKHEQNQEAAKSRGHNPESPKAGIRVMSPDLEERRRALRESAERAGRLYNEGEIE